MNVGRQLTTAYRNHRARNKRTEDFLLSHDPVMITKIFGAQSPARTPRRPNSRSPQRSSSNHHHNAVEMRPLTSANTQPVNYYFSLNGSRDDSAESPRSQGAASSVARGRSRSMSMDYYDGDDFYVRSRRLSYDGLNDLNSPQNVATPTGSQQGRGSNDPIRRVEDYPSAEDGYDYNITKCNSSSDESADGQQQRRPLFAEPNITQSTDDNDVSGEVDDVGSDDLDTSALISDEVTYFAEPPYYFMCTCRFVLLMMAAVIAMRVPCFNAVSCFAYDLQSAFVKVVHYSR
jgi:hypothetical protein